MNDAVRAGAARDAGEPAQAPYHVLIVDDDPDMSAYLALLLRNEGMDPDVANDGEKAITRALTSYPDLILLDVMMPGMNGFEVCRALKSDPATALLPVVLITALEDQDSRVRGIEAGADDFLSKPINREELLARVRTLRRLHETRKELESRRLASEAARVDALRAAVSRYISPLLADRMLNQKIDDSGVFPTLRDRAAVVVLFADLRGFTRLSETVPVWRIVPMLNEFFTQITAAAYENEGTVFSMAGDSLLVGFNVPISQPDAAERALATGRSMIRRFTPVAQRWKTEHGLSVGIGIGIEAGEVVVGNVGSPTFMSYTIIGDAVNVAARLMQMAAPSEILLGPGVCLALKPLLGGVAASDRREVAIRGKAEPVEILAIRVSPE
jgi:class 3 adenylate cyclase